MRVIISHDIDHLKVTEHLFSDSIIPKYMVRMKIELLSGKISLKEYALRWKDIFGNKWQNIDELISFNTEKGVPSSFFIGVNKGLGLSYDRADAAVWIQHLISKNFEVNVHGIEFTDLNAILFEKNAFKEISQLQEVGMRMHYVRNNGNTLQMLADAGYKFDSTENSFKDPYRIGNMWEFPFQIMDGWVIEHGKRWQTRNLQQSKDETERLIQKAYDADLKYIGIDFHDRYFSPSYHTWMNWYVWLVEYLISNKVEFVNFNSAIEQLENK